MVSSVSQKQRQLVQDRRLDLDYANSQYAYSRTNDKRQLKARQEEAKRLFNSQIADARRFCSAVEDGKRKMVITLLRLVESQLQHMQYNIVLTNSLKNALLKKLEADKSTEIQWPSSTSNSNVSLPQDTLTTVSPKTHVPIHVAKSENFRIEVDAGKPARDSPVDRSRSPESYTREASQSTRRTAKAEHLAHNLAEANTPEQSSLSDFPKVPVRQTRFSLSASNDDLPAAKRSSDLNAMYDRDGMSEIVSNIKVSQLASDDSVFTNAGVNPVEDHPYTDEEIDQENSGRDTHHFSSSASSYETDTDTDRPKTKGKASRVLHKLLPSAWGSEQAVERGQEGMLHRSQPRVLNPINTVKRTWGSGQIFR